MTLGLFLASWYKGETEAQKFNGLPGFRRGHSGAGIPALACLAFSGPPFCLRISCSPERSLEVRGLVACQLPVLIPDLDLSLPVCKMQLLNWLTICSFFQKESSFSGSHYLEQGHRAARARYSGVFAPCAPLWPSDHPAPGIWTETVPFHALLSCSCRSCPPTPYTSRQHVSLGPLPEPLCALERPLDFC